MVSFMRKQGEPSVNEGVDTWVSCAYRDPQGRKCAVGCLIPDEAYEGYMEGFSVSNARVSFKLHSLGLTQHLHLLNRLQNAHDFPVGNGLRGAAWLAEFEVMARRIAEGEGLEYPQ